MTHRSLGGALVAILFMITAAPAAAKDAACWQFVYRIIERNAASPHVPFISYSETERITDHGQRYEEAAANITYRDDGMAYVDDDRFVHPFVSTFLEPGPPVLGPYGPGRRESWLAFEQPARGLDVIADARTDERTACVDLGDQTIDGARYAHIVFPESPANVPSLKALWVDRQTFRVQRLIVSGWITFSTESGMVHDLTSYTVDLRRIGGIDVLHDVWWNYTYSVYGQRSRLDAHYSFANFRFDTKPPVGTLFATERDR